MPARSGGHATQVQLTSSVTYNWFRSVHFHIGKASSTPVFKAVMFSSVIC